MKGTAHVLAYGKTPNEHKRWLLSHIKVNRSLIRTLDASTIIEWEDKQPLLQTLRREVKELLDEMIELERLRKREGLAPDDPYKPPSQLEYERKERGEK